MKSEWYKFVGMTDYSVMQRTNNMYALLNELDNALRNLSNVSNDMGTYVEGMQNDVNSDLSSKPQEIYKQINLTSEKIATTIMSVSSLRSQVSNDIEKFKRDYEEYKNYEESKHYSH